VLKELVADSIEEFKAGRKLIIIAPIHRDGKEFAEALRASMKGEGMLGQQDHEIARLERCDLSESQKADAIQRTAAEHAHINAIERNRQAQRPPTQDRGISL
jgi:hypothetical protein